MLEERVFSLTGIKPPILCAVVKGVAKLWLAAPVKGSFFVQPYAAAEKFNII